MIYHSSDVTTDAVMLDLETVLLATMAYTAGLLAFTLLSRAKKPDGRGATGEQAKRLQEYEGMLVDMMIRLDTLEMRGQPQAGTMSQPPATSQPARDVGHSHPAGQAIPPDANSMIEYVLKLLLDGPKTSRQIEAVIGRSREHTARLMKKLFGMGYVARDTVTKPYAYSITETGRSAVQGIKVSA